MSALVVLQIVKTRIDLQLLASRKNKVDTTSQLIELIQLKYELKGTMKAIGHDMIEIISLADNNFPGMTQEMIDDQLLYLEEQYEQVQIRYDEICTELKQTRQSWKTCRANYEALKNDCQIIKSVATV